MGVGAYFLKVFFVAGQVERSVCSEEWASWRVLRSVRKLQSLVFATSGGFAQFNKLRDAA